MWRLRVVLISLLFSVSAFGQERALDMTGIHDVQPAPGFLQRLIIKYLPDHLTPTEDRDEASKEIQQKVVQKVGQDLFRDFNFKGTSFEKLATTLKTYGSKSLNLMASHSPAQPAPLRLEIETYEGKASVNYIGIIHSALSYVGFSHNLEFTISKQLSQNTVLSLKAETPVSGIDFSDRLQIGYTF